MASDVDRVSGLWRARDSGRAQPCQLGVDASGTATVKAGDATLGTAPFAALTISDRVGSIPRHVTFPDGSDFETVDNDGIDALAVRFGRTGGGIHRLESAGLRRLAVFIVLAVALSAALYRYALPILVEVAVAATPPAVNQLMSRGVMASLDSAILEPSAVPAERQAKLSTDFAALAELAAKGETATRYTLNFRKGGAIGANAFALPDGTVVLTDELVEMATDDEMILGVLAHEIGHVVYEHSLRQLYRAAGVAGLIMLIGGDIGSGTEDVLVQGAALMSLSYSRGAEREADHYSVELMHRAGHEAAAIARFFEVLRDKLGDTLSRDFFSTHPATPERIDETRRYAAELTGQTPGP